MQRKHLLFSILVTLLIILAAGVTWVIAQGDGEIHACVNPSGQPRIVNSAADCTSQETFLSWDSAAPSGTVMLYDLNSCPAGWSPLTGAQGRAIVGLPLAGTVGGAVGSPLGNLENRTHSHGANPVPATSSTVGPHAHSVDLPEAGTSSVGNHAHTLGLPNTTVGAAAGLNIVLAGSNHIHAVSPAGGHDHTYNPESTGTSGSGGHSHLVDLPQFDTSTRGTADVLPYIQLLVCRKN